MVKRGLATVMGAVIVAAVACSTQESVSPQTQPSLTGTWRYGSMVIENCTEPADDRSESCTGTAVSCGLLTLTENTWTWTQTLPDGSQFTEAGSYMLSGNYFILSGASVPGTKMYSISGSVFSYTSTSLTFVNSSEATGCTYTIRYARHLQPFNPFG